MANCVPEYYPKSGNFRQFRQCIGNSGNFGIFGNISAISANYRTCRKYVGLVGFRQFRLPELPKHYRKCRNCRNIPDFGYVCDAYSIHVTKQISCTFCGIVGTEIFLKHRVHRIEGTSASAGRCRCLFFLVC